jgi:hypothetical protein
MGNEWVSKEDYEEHSNFDFKTIHGVFQGLKYEISQLSPDNWKMTLGGKEVLFNVPKSEIMSKYPFTRMALKEIKSGLEASRKKEKFGLG